MLYVINSEQRLFDHWWFHLTVSASIIVTINSHVCRPGVYSTRIKGPVASNLNWIVLPTLRKSNLSFLEDSPVSCVPAPFQVWTLGLCVCLLKCFQTLCRATDHMRDLKQPNRLVITANQAGGLIVEEAYRWRSVQQGEREPQSVRPSPAPFPLHRRSQAC